MFHELKIDKEFEEIVDAMTDEEFQLLEEKILEDGCIINPIVTWNGVIVDGHNRYKIATKHPEIPFSVKEMEFECREAVGVWICKTQLARRNLNENRRRYLIGKQYQKEKILEKFHGNQYTSANHFGEVHSEPHQKEHGSRTKVAKEHGVSNSYVQRADHYAQGIDVAEQAVPGIKKDIISGKVDASFKEVADLRNLPEEERKIATELLKMPPKMRRFDPDNQAAKQKLPIEEGKEDVEEEPEENEDESFEESKPKKEERSFEDSLIITYDGIITTFIASSNNLLVRFPFLKSEPKYREQILERLQNASIYIKEAERFLKNEN